MLRSMQYSIAFTGLDLDEKDCRRLIEDDLPDFRFSILNLPPQAPPEIMRMSGVIENKHILLNLSNSRADLIIQFDENHSRDERSRFDYGYTKFSDVIETLKKQNVNINYIGSIAQHSVGNSNPVAAIQRIVKVDNQDGGVFNLGVKFTLVQEDKFYVNLEVANWRHRSPIMSEQNQSIGVVVDINNRYGIEIKGLNPDVEDLEKIEKIQRSITEDKINSLLITGVFNIE